MSPTVAILGLGETGAYWSRICLRAGWRVSAFDPDPAAHPVTPTKGGWKRYETISETVRRADVIILCVPSRLDLIRMVVQRAQSEAPVEAIVVSTARTHDIEEVQTCALRPAQVIHLVDAEDGGFALHLTEKNSDDVRARAKALLPELAAVASLEPRPERRPDQSDDALSA